MPDEALDIDIEDLQRRMDGAMSSLKTEFASLRTGRASGSILDPILVDAYGQMTPINQVGTVNVPIASPDSRLDGFAHHAVFRLPCAKSNERHLHAVVQQGDSRRRHARELVAETRGERVEERGPPRKRARLASGLASRG